MTITHDLRHLNKVMPEDEPAATSSGANAGATDFTEAEGGQMITTPCQKEEGPCPSQRAYYIQMQMRSADEPATTFFKCVECGYQWRQD